MNGESLVSTIAAAGLLLIITYLVIESLKSTDPYN